MKRVLLLASISLLAMPLSRAQESPTTASLSEITENYKVLQGTVKDLQDANNSLERKISDLQSKLDALSAQQGKSAGNAATEDELNKLRDDIQAVDQKRMADNDKIIKTLQDISSKLGKTTTIAASTPARTSTPPAASPRMETGPEPAQPAGPGFMYEVKPDDTPGKIARKLFAEKGIKITGEQIMQANPQVKDATKLYIGQKLFIPVPKTASTDTANNN